MNQDTEQKIEVNREAINKFFAPLERSLERLKKATDEVVDEAHFHANEFVGVAKEDRHE